MRRSYGDLSPSGKPNSHFYPVDFCQREYWGSNWGFTSYSTCIKKNWAENDDPGRACHGADVAYAFGKNYDNDEFGKAVSEAYGSFFRDGVIPPGHDWSLNTFQGRIFRS